MKNVNHPARFVLTVLLLVVFTGAHAQLKHLQNVSELPPHPRILMLAGEELQIKANIAAEPAWANIHQAIIGESDNLLTAPVSERILEGRRLLGVSREALRRIFFLSYSYRLTGQSKYADRAEKEMLAVAAFSDWNPSHFLDVAEMTMAVAIGYDWVYDRLSSASREIIRKAILKKGMDISLSSSYNGWLRASHNWNQVCNAGMTYGALAVYEDAPELSKMIIDRAVESIVLSMHEYGPDGAYPEGYGYWGYGTSFNVMFLSAIDKVLKTDYSLMKTPGFMRTGSYIANMTGATGQCFNYGDNGLGGSMQPPMFWFASNTNDKTILWTQRQFMETNTRGFTRSRLLPAAIIWGSHIRLSDIGQPKELMWVGQGEMPVALMRTSWMNPNGIFAGYKVGRGATNHAHLDVGSFVMEADGVRWASDFGPQDYNSLEQEKVDLWNMKQNSQRWQVYRYNNFVHNTLTVDNQLHAVEGMANFVSWSSNIAFMNAIADLSKVFNGQLAKSVRGVAVVGGKYVAVRDEVTALGKETTIRWTMLTTATATITGKNTIVLRKDGKRLTLQVEEPANVTMKTWPTTPTNSFDAPNPGTVLVGFEIKIPAGASTALTVKLIPQSVTNAGAKIQPLSAWPK